MVIYTENNRKDALHLIGKTVIVCGDKCVLVAIGDSSIIGFTGYFLIAFDGDLDDSIWVSSIEFREYVT